MFSKINSKVISQIQREIFKELELIEGYSIKILYHKLYGTIRRYQDNLDVKLSTGFDITGIKDLKVALLETLVETQDMFFNYREYGNYDRKELYRIVNDLIVVILLHYGIRIEGKKYIKIKPEHNDRILIIRATLILGNLINTLKNDEILLIKPNDIKDNHVSSTVSN